MKNLTVLFFILIFALTVCSQTFEEKKSYVREKYSEIENNLVNYTEKTYLEQPDENYPPSAYYDFWFNSENKVVKARLTMGEEGYSDEENYYFDNGKLFFVFTESCEPNWDLEVFAQDCVQIRTYLYNEEVFDCLIKDIKADDERDYIPNKQSTGDYKEIAEIDLKNAKEILEISLQAE